MQEAASPGDPIISPQVWGQSQEEEDRQPAGLVRTARLISQQQGCGRASWWPPFSLESHGTVCPPEDQVTGFQASAPTPPPPHPLTFTWGNPAQDAAASCAPAPTPWRPGPVLWGPGRHLLTRPPSPFLHPGSFLQAPVSRGAQPVSWPWQVTDGKEQAGFHPSPGDRHAPDLPEKDPAKGPLPTTSDRRRGIPRGTPHPQPATTKAVTVPASPAGLTGTPLRMLGRPPPPRPADRPRQGEDPPGSGRLLLH